METEVSLIFERWEKAIGDFCTALKAANVAELNYDSELARAIEEQERASTAEKMAKGDPGVQRAKGEMLEEQRHAKAEQEKIKFLEARHNWIKLKYRVENRITGGM